MLSSVSIRRRVPGATIATGGCSRPSVWRTSPFGISSTDAPSPALMRSPARWPSASGGTVLADLRERVVDVDRLLAPDAPDEVDDADRSSQPITIRGAHLSG